MNKLAITMLLAKKYPCTHAMLDTVYSRILPGRGHVIKWVMRAGDSRPIPGFDKVSWNDSEVFLYQGDSSQGNIPKFIHRFRHQWLAASQIHAAGCMDIIQVRNDWVSGLVGVFAQRFWKVPFVFQLSFPPNAFPNNSNGLQRRIGSFSERMTQLLLNEAALILPISQWMLNELVEKGVPAMKMMAFPLGADTSVDLSLFDGEAVRVSLSLENRPTLIYFGEMGRFRQLDFLLQVVDLVRTEIPDIVLLMVGKSEEAPQDLVWLKETSFQMGLSNNVIFTGYVPRALVPNYIAAAHIGVSPIPPNSTYWISSPTKVVETMLMAKPVVANDIPEQKMLLCESGGGLCVSYEQKDFANAILFLVRHPSNATSMGVMGRGYIEKNRSYEILASRVENAYFKLLN